VIKQNVEKCSSVYSIKIHCCDVYSCDINCALVGYNINKDFYCLVELLWNIHCATSRRVPGSIPGHWGFFSGASDSSMCPGVDSVSKNEYQYIPGVKMADA
jgi:hypothetical protein